MHTMLIFQIVLKCSFIFIFVVFVVMSDCHDHESRNSTDL